MTRNVTIRLDESIIKMCRHAAVEEDKSLSQWIAGVLLEKISDKDEYLRARGRALKRLKKGFHLGGEPLVRAEIYER